MEPKYDPELVKPLWEPLVTVGFESITTGEGVREALARPGTLLCLINSVCGCAARNARPGAALSLQGTPIPDHLITVFAGMDHGAVAEARAAMIGVPPSSPSFALFSNGKLVESVGRHEIEGMTALELAGHLRTLYNSHCTRTGPSVPPEVFDTVEFAMMCSSSLLS